MTAARKIRIHIAAAGLRLVLAGAGYRDLPTSSADGGAGYSNLIHVFDWEGRLLGIWELDARLIAVAGG